GTHDPEGGWPEAGWPEAGWNDAAEVTAAGGGGGAAGRRPADGGAGALRRGPPARAPGAPDRAGDAERGAAARPARPGGLPRPLRGPLRVRSRRLSHPHRR